MTPSGRVAIYVGSSVQDIRLTATVALRGGTCAEGSDAVGDGGEYDSSDTPRAAADARSGV